MELTVQSPVLTAAMQYASYGWRVVPIHGIVNGRCTCSKGSTCGSAGKHPRPNAWQEAASNDEEIVLGFWEKWPDSNLGVALGPSSGIIDIECDTEEAEISLLSLFDGEIPVTPTFSASRGKHRLFKWRDDLPKDAVKKPYGIEFRMGAGGRGAQSVFPPSTHNSGKAYAWLPGLDPDQCDPAPLPDKVLAAVWNVEENTPLLTGETPLKPGRSNDEWAEIFKGVAAGERNQTAAAFCGKIISEMKNCHDGGSVRRLWQLVVAWNHQNRPPLEADELKATFQSILQRERRKRTETEYRETVSPETPWDSPQTGWGLQIIESRPRVYRLRAPQWPDKYVELSVEQLCRPQLIREQAVEQADACPGPGFDKIWTGKADRDQPPLLMQLLGAAEHIPAPPESRRDAVVAAALLDAITANPRTLEDGQEPSPSGHPCRLSNGSIVFRFNSVWEPLRQRADKVMRPELANVIRAVSGSKPPIVRFNGKTRWHCFDKAQVEKLRELAEGEGHA